ncbi:uncharacterized protein LOC106176972 [Lingula anatina]|uniref:Uncharacterized protein LOC106176972 n=1 Tax=Lingula anatina TaxID=7574 RepID=A0A1S3JXC6_LINAN|nr:uncharacterized protein LOC106176972 [Lingula anatina]|eukprot:XP_013415028.1 uncharacterized protein LOC106176972 [Lingula anatina]
MTSQRNAMTTMGQIHGVCTNYLCYVQVTATLLLLCQITAGYGNVNSEVNQNLPGISARNIPEDGPEIFFVRKMKWNGHSIATHDSCDITSILLTCSQSAHASGEEFKWETCGAVRSCITKASVRCTHKHSQSHKQRHKVGEVRRKKYHDVSSSAETCVDQISQCIRDFSQSKASCQTRLKTCVHQNQVFCANEKLEILSRRIYRPLLRELRKEKN